MNPADNTLLAVDDNPINLKLLARLLANTKFNVLTAKSGMEAIEIAQEHKPDLILLDVLMPEMDGYETCKRLKKEPLTENIPIIFLSAKNESVDKAKGLSLGAVDYLIKPFDPVEILARIRLHINMRADLRELQQKYEALQNELDKLNRNGGLAGMRSEEVQYIDGLKPVRYSKSSKYFRVATSTRFATSPVTTVFIPVLFKEQELLFILLGGFNKDYPTSIVQSMLGEFASGLATGIGRTFFDERSLNSMFETILKSFSPDDTKVAFTISMGHLFASKSELTVFSIHQSMPLILDQKGVLVKGETLPIYIESEFARIINAQKVRLPKKATLINYLSGNEVTSLQTFEELCLKHLGDEDVDIQQTVNIISDNFPAKENDQLVCAIKLL